jgi:hypothetical protein
MGKTQDIAVLQYSKTAYAVPFISAPFQANRVCVLRYAGSFFVSS